MTQPTLSLAQRFLVRIGELSERSDVIVRRMERALRPKRLARWQKLLPAEMLAFYEELNGLAFRYAFVDAPAEEAGLELWALGEEGKQACALGSGEVRATLQAAKRYGAGSWPAEAIDREAKVLLLAAGANGEGVLMEGTGAAARFHLLAPGGGLEQEGASWEEVIERLMARGFTSSAARAAQLETPAPPRVTCQLRVLAREVHSAASYRRACLASRDAACRARLLKVLGQERRARGLSDADQLELLVQSLPTPATITPVQAAGVMKALGVGAGESGDFIDAFEAFLQFKTEALVQLKLEVSAEAGAERLCSSEALLRVLLAIPELALGRSLTAPQAALRYLPQRPGASWLPFAHSSAPPFQRIQQLTQETGGARSAATFEVLLPEAWAGGLEPGPLYSSSARP